MHLTASRDGDPPPDDRPLPIGYIMYRWRKEMGITYQEMLNTPWSVISGDIEYISLENEYSRPKDQP